MTPADLLRRALGADAARPLLTYYDDGTGERVELSVATFDNWVAKTANLLQDGLTAEPGERVVVALPAHWQTAAILLACWSTGLVVAPAGTSCDLAFVSEPDITGGGLDVAAMGARDVVALSLRPLGGRLAAPRPDVLDYAVETPSYADRFTAYSAPGDDDAAFQSDGRVVTAGELVNAATGAAQGWGFGAGDRVLSTLSYSTLDGLLAGLLAPLAAGAGVVLCRNLDPALLPGRCAAERVTHTAGAGLEGLPRVH